MHQQRAAAERGRAAYLPGDSTVQVRAVQVPRPGPHQVLLRVHASGICGSDLRCAYFEHVGVGPEAYQGVVAGHEPAGEVVATGDRCERLGTGDRVAVYHISGCGQCLDCRRGYMISCTAPSRAANGSQRHRAWLLGDPPRRIVKRVIRAQIRPLAPVLYLAHYDMNRSTDETPPVFSTRSALPCPGSDGHSPRRGADEQAGARFGPAPTNKRPGS
jgi:hypothetical protein